MKKIIKSILISSILLNILCLVLGSYEVYKKGGIGWLSLKVNTTINKNNYKQQPDYYEIKKSIYNDLNNNNNAIVFVGDSLTDNYEWNELFENYNIQNRGISGDTTAGVLDRIESIANQKPYSVFIMIGINDFRNGMSSDYVFNKYKEIIDKINNISPNTNIFIESDLPVNIEMANHYYNTNDIIMLNEKLSEIKSDNVKYLDIFDLLKTEDNQLDEKYTYDGVHLNTLGYSKWLSVISDYIK